MSVLRLSAALIRAFVTKCLDRADDTEHKAALEDFTRDLLLLLGRPEWPAAVLMAEKLGTVFCQRLHTAKDSKPSIKDPKEQNSRAIAVDLLGSLLAALFEHKRKHADSPLTFPEVRTDYNAEAQPNDEGEVLGCLCGVTKYNDSQSYMLDCDLCHRWFHGACVGVPDGVVCEQWFCDHCRLSTSVSDQRQRIARLLALPNNNSRLEDGDVEMVEDVEEAPEVTALCSETETAKQLLLNYLQSSATADPAADTAQSALLCEWHKEASDSGSQLLCSLYQEQQRLALKARRRYRTSSTAELALPMPLLSRGGIIAASRRLMSESGLYTKAETMLSHLLMVLKDPQPSSRARAVKALREVVKSDPVSLALRGVTVGVQMALQDTSIAVREGTLDLLGHFLNLRPEFIARYYTLIASRLSDPGVSVRKRVIKILREIITSRDIEAAAGPISASPSKGDPSTSAADGALVGGRGGMERAVDACCRLMTRLGPSEEEDIHKLVLRTFTDLFFAPNTDDASTPLPAAECASRCEMLVAVVAKTAASGTSGVQRCEWLGGILRRMLSPDAESSKATQREAAAAEKLCHQLVGQLMEALLQLEEHVGEAPDQQQFRSEMGQTLHVLALFCAAQPSLLVAHIDVLAQFLHYEHATKAVHHICQMLPPLLKILDHPPSKLMMDLEKTTSALVFKVNEALLPTAIAALAATIRTSGNASLIVTILARFDSFLERYLKGLAKPAAFMRNDVGKLLTVSAAGGVSISGLSPTKAGGKSWYEREVDWTGASPHRCRQDEIVDVEERVGGAVTLASGATFPNPRPGVKATSAYRAMLSGGLLCQYYDFDNPVAVAHGETEGGEPLVISGAKLAHSLHKKITSLAQPHRPAPTILYAYKGLGQMTARKPRLLLENVDLIGRALKADAPAALKRQALTNLQMQLSNDEDRQRTLGSSDSGAARGMVSYEDMHDASQTSAAVTGALQHHLPAILDAMLDPQDVSVRHAALTLVGSLLSAGLAHPAKILPKVLALEADQGEGGTAEAAMGELRKQYERHKEMLSASSIAVEGAKEAHKLFAAHAAAAAAATTSTQQPTGRFTFMYTLHAASRKPRSSYLRALLSMLSVEQHESIEDESLTEELRLCEWLGHVLAEMPYDKEADVLGVVHHANRMLSLAAEPTVAAAAKLLGDDDYQENPKPPAEVTAAVADALGVDGAADQAWTITRACHMCAVVAITLKLKQHIKRVFALSDLRCQGFDPLDAAKAPERPIMRMAELPTDSRTFSSLASGGATDAVTTCATQYLWLRSLMADDEVEFDFNLLTATPKPPAAPGSDSKSRKRPSSGAGGGASSGRGRGRPPSSGRGRGSGGGSRGSGGLGGKAKKPKAKKRKKSDSSSDDEEVDEDSDYAEAEA